MVGTKRREEKCGIANVASTLNTNTSFTLRSRDERQPPATITMDIDEVGSLAISQPSLSCRIAVVGSQCQRVAKVITLLGADKYRGCIFARDSSASSPVTIDIEYLPCVATFDSYEDQRGNIVRYLAKLEYYEPNGGAQVGKSLAPFFDELYSAGGNTDGANDDENPFPGISAFAIGCGIENDEDVDKIQRFLETLSSSCAAQISQSRADDEDNNNNFLLGITIECIKPNPEFASLAEENNAFRELNEYDKKVAVANGTMGPGKMANFVYKTAQSVVQHRLMKQTNESQLSRNMDAQDSVQQLSSGQQASVVETPNVGVQALGIHIPNSNLTRYACRICRSVLFGVEDQEDPPHSQSLHDFRKKRQKVGYSNAGKTCQNYCIAQPLPWMDGCSGVEGKLHCPKCKTKVGHYSWTGAQCSCGTWVTPAIMIPLSKVDEMKPTMAAAESSGPTVCHPSSQQQSILCAVWDNSSDTMMDVTDN